MLTTALAFVAASFSVARAWPQVWRIAVRCDVSGVSASTWTLMLVHHVLWVAWSVGERVAAVAVANGLAAIGCVAVLVTMARHCDFHARSALMLAIGVGAAGSLAMSAGLHTVVAGVTTVITGFMVLPQVRSAFDDRIKGISAATWWLALLSSVIWNAYYLLIDKYEMTAPNFVIFPSSVIILARVYQCRHRRQPAVQGRAFSAKSAVGTS
jgi:uncharacterized protein with PQ loop repeat